MADQFIAKMERLGPLSDQEKALLASAAKTSKIIEADQDLGREGDRPRHCCLILDGFACRYKATPQGKRQILSIHIAGDICDLQSFTLGVLDHSLATLTPCTVAFIPHETISDWTDNYPRLTRALWRDTLVDGSIFREWILNVGARDAYTRLAHLLCEISVRLEAVGPTTDRSYELPLTQAEIGQSIGASLVHVNRVLQDLRREDLISLKRGNLVIKDWEGLKEAGQFDPAYLHYAASAA